MDLYQDLYLWPEPFPPAEPTLATASKLAHTCQPAFTHMDQAVQGLDRRQMAWPWDPLSFQIVLSHEHVLLVPREAVLCLLPCTFYEWFSQLQSICFLWTGPTPSGSHIKSKCYATCNPAL